MCWQVVLFIQYWCWLWVRPTLLLITELDKGGPGFQHLTEEEIAAYVLNASAMDEGSDNELDKPWESTIKK